MHWVIESEVFSGQAAGLIQAVQAAGHGLTLWSDELLERTQAPWSAQTVLFHGALGTAVALRETTWAPRIFCDVGGLHSSAYYPRYEAFRLNQVYEVLPAKQAVAEKARIFKRFGAQVFVRPDSPLKEFSGRVLDRAGFSMAGLDHGFYFDDPDLPVLLAPTQVLGAEWRFVVAGDQVVAASGYSAEAGRQVGSAEVDPAALALAQEIAVAVPGPEALYVLDLVHTAQGYRLLELNSFSCSDLYACDPTRVVRAVSEALL